MTLSSDNFPRLAEWRIRHGIKVGYVLHPSMPKAPTIEQWHFPLSRKVAYVFMYQRDGVPSAWAIAGELTHGPAVSPVNPVSGGAAALDALEAVARWAGIE